MTDNIVFSSNPAQDLHAFLTSKNYSRVAVLADHQTQHHCYPLVREGLGEHDIISIPDGEEHKTLSSCEKIWSQLTKLNFDRHSVVVILGGGVLGDMGGFCASTYKRGIDFVLVPTTLLAQVDASIGGKLGIDFQNFKNHIGVFRTPVLTLLYSGFLNTLPHNEKRSGFAEVIKHALISSPEVWKEISGRPFEDQQWRKLIEHSVNTKLHVVRQDPYEKGLRKTLNLGHTIGHALETFLLSSGKKILHGEAIAVGLICEAFLSAERKMLSQTELDSILKYILSVFGSIDLQPDDHDQVAKLSLQDKKNKGNKVLCVLLNGIGNAKWDCEISLDEVKRALTFYRSHVD